MMKKQQEIALLREYAQLRDVYEQTNTLSILMGEILEADRSVPYYNEEIRRIMERMTPDARQLKGLLEAVEAELLPQMDRIQDALQQPLQVCAMSDLIAEIYEREDVPDLESTIRLVK